MSEAGIPVKRAQEILGHRDIRTTLAIYTHTMKSRHDDSADRMADVAGLAQQGNISETQDSEIEEKGAVNDCLDGSRDGFERLINSSRIQPFESAGNFRYPRIYPEVKPLPS